ncbi:hypothetical protein MRX96_033007 [Rhipicephalus microplus]
MKSPHERDPQRKENISEDAHNFSNAKTAVRNAFHLKAGAERGGAVSTVVPGHRTPTSGRAAWGGRGADVAARPGRPPVPLVQHRSDIILVPVEAHFNQGLDGLTSPCIPVDQGDARDK